MELRYIMHQGVEIWSCSTGYVWKRLNCNAKYNKYYKVLTEVGCRIVKQDFLPHLNDDKQYSETDR